MGQFTVDLSGKSAIVTGAGNGVGRAIALALGQAGASVCVNDINPDTCESVAEEIVTGGGQAFGWQADVSNRFQVGSMIEEVRDRFGSIAIVVNAADVQKHIPMLKLDEWDWRRVLDVNLTGAFFVTQLAGRVMSDEGGGTIVNLVALPTHTLDTGVSFSASKAAVTSLTQQAAHELAADNIRVNAVAYGTIQTPDVPEPDVSQVLMNHAGTPEDVANAVLFLCSDGANFINGQTLTVNG